MTKQTARRSAALALATMLSGATLASCGTPNTGTTLTRFDDPVVLTGAKVGALAGTAPDRLMAFATTADNGWTQIPVQVDERVNTRMHNVYGMPASTRFYSSSIDIPVNVYADPNTFVGADPDAGLDADDEIAFMSRDAGGAAGSRARPAGTSGGGVEVKVGDPTNPSSAGYVYLFPGDGTLSPGAGKQYVKYDFRLNSGDYKTTYNRTDGPNPETSTIAGTTYTAGFSDRWTMDKLSLTKGNKPTTDIIDRVKWDIPLLCIRHENTFNDEEGAFIINKSGPVRALRSWVGANSGPNTQNTQAYYDTSMAFTVDLRVHAIPSVGAHVDFNREAFGMVYRNPQVPNGVTIDGQPDTVPAGVPTWWTYTGAQGNIAMTGTYSTDATAAPSTKYEDDLTPAATQCTGDAETVGDSGGVFASSIECTDPGSANCTKSLRYNLRTVAVPPQRDAAGTRQIAERNLQPLTTAVTPRA